MGGVRYGGLSDSGRGRIARWSDALGFDAPGAAFRGRCLGWSYKEIASALRAAAGVDWSLTGNQVREWVDLEAKRRGMLYIGLSVKQFRFYLALYGVEEAAEPVAA